MSVDADRAAALLSLQDEFDVLIVGGGATGLGLAVDASTRGYRTALVEAGDFAQATSSRSTKLVHGGVRYLANGQIHLVREALHERAVMMRNAPHLVHPLPTLLPAAHWWELPYYGAGLSAYDLLSGSASMGPTRMLGREVAAALIPGMRVGVGAVLYHDAQFNDARYALALARTAIDHRATVVNYARCSRFVYGADGKITGAIVGDVETGAETAVTARVVINAAGIFSDEVRRTDEPGRAPLLTVSRGTHIVVAARFLGGSHALMVPKTADGRVIFAIPWQGVTVIGTTDVVASSSVIEPGYTSAEIDYLLEHIAPYLSAKVGRGDILSIFSGLRPLVTGQETKTSKLSREHHIDASETGLITVAGGKWTTYRRMAEDTLDFAIRQGALAAKPCVSAQVVLHGMGGAAREEDRYLAEYGTDASEIAAQVAAEPGLAERIDPELPYTFAMVMYAVRREMARTVDDVLARRTRSLLLNASAAVRAAPKIAELMAYVLGRDGAWVKEQVASFQALANRDYLLL